MKRKPGKQTGLKSFSFASRLRAIAAIQVIICALLFVFLAIDRPLDDYRAYQQDTAQACALFSALSSNQISSTIEASKYAGQIGSSAAERTFIANALEKGRIQNNYGFGHELYTHTKGLMDQQHYLDCAAVFDLNGDAVYVLRQGSSYYLTRSSADARWLSDVTARRGGAVLFAPGQREAVGLPLMFDDQLVVARAVFDPLKLKSQGVYLLSIPRNAFDEIFYSVRVLPGQEYALSYEGNLLFTNFSTETPPMPSGSDFPQRELTTQPVFLDGTLWTYGYYPYGQDSMLIIRTPLSAIFSVFQFNLLLLLFLFAALCLFVLIIRSLLHSILDPLRHMTSAFEATTDTFFPTITEEDLPTDLEPLFHAYNRMSTRIGSLVNEGLRKDVATREMELQLLRTQINPHYLYNTLECIHMRAYVNHDYEVARMAELLGANLQYGLRATNARVPLHVEFDKANEYMTLVGYHYGDRVRLISHLDESIRECMVIKLMLQPVIENAIQHGITEERPLTIEVLGYPLDSETLCLQISDDGKGMTEEDCRALMRRLDEENGERAIGLRNVHRRLRLRYGAAYGVTIRSIPDESTVVTLKLPIEFPTEYGKEHP